MLFSIPDDFLSRCIKLQPSSFTRTILFLPQRIPCLEGDQGKKDEIKTTIKGSNPSNKNESYQEARTLTIRPPTHCVPLHVLRLFYF